MRVVGLTTSAAGVWVLQALTGVEMLPARLGLRPFVPSLYPAPMLVDTDAGMVPIADTAQYAELAGAGVIDAAGVVDAPVREWLTVLGRSDRQVALTIRRPDPQATEVGAVAVAERTLVVGRYRDWLAMCARDGEEVVIDAVGETSDAGVQFELITDTVVAALGSGRPAAIEGFNVPTAALREMLEHCGPVGRDAVEAGLRRLGVSGDAVAVVAAACQLDESAMGVVSVTDVGLEPVSHPGVVSVADTDFGRLTLSMSTASDGTEWTTVWPATPAGVRDDVYRLVSAPMAAAPA